MGHLSLSLSLRQECFSLNSRLNVNQEPQMQIRVGVCCSKPLWAKQAKKRVQTLYVTLCLNLNVTECVVDLSRLHCSCTVRMSCTEMRSIIKWTAHKNMVKVRKLKLWLRGSWIHAMYYSRPPRLNFIHN